MSVKNEKFETVDSTFRDRRILKAKGIEKEDMERFARVRATKDFGDVHKGELGGFIERPNKGYFNNQETPNIPHDDDSWVYDDAIVMQDAYLENDARVNKGSVISNAVVDNSVVSNSGVRLSDVRDSKVYNSRLYFTIDAIENSYLDKSDVSYIEGITNSNLHSSRAFGDSEAEFPTLSIKDSSLEQSGAIGHSIVGGSSVKGSTVRDSIVEDIVADESFVIDSQTTQSTIKQSSLYQVSSANEDFIDAKVNGEKGKSDDMGITADDLKDLESDSALTMTEDDLRDLESDSKQL